jgi:N utilization substance protein A
VPTEFIEDALSPAQVLSIKVVSEPNEETGERGHAIAEVLPDQQSLAIGRGGQNVRLAAKLTGWKIDIVSAQTGEPLAEATASGVVAIEAATDTPIGSDIDVLENEDGTTVKPALPEEDQTMSDRDVNPDSEEFDEIDTPEEAEALVGEEIEAAEATTEDSK